MRHAAFVTVMTVATSPAWSGSDKLSVNVASGEGPSLRCTVPADAWADGQGTLGMRIRVSRRVGHAADGKPRGLNLVNCPGIRVELWEHKDCPHLRVYPPGEAKRPVGICRIAYLEPGKAYHFAVAWKAATGQVDLYVNGWAQQKVQLPPWRVAERPTGLVQLGGALDEGDKPLVVKADDPEMWPWTMTEAQMRTALKGRELPDVGAGARRRIEEPLDLSGYALEPVFKADFTKPLDIVAEDALFEDDKRVRQPKPGQWVLEGPGKAFTKDGQLTIDNLEDTNRREHVVLWLPRPFPDNILLEFDITVERADTGLAIVFFAARPVGDPTSSIFKPGLARRNGLFTNYITGDVNSYHVSYCAASGSAAMGGARRTANVRKNSGFWLVACGDDQIHGKGVGRGPHRVRFLKVGAKIRVEAAGKLEVAFDDDGKTYGPVWGDGYIGLRQMNHILSAQYRNLTVYAVKPRK